MSFIPGSERPIPGFYPLGMVKSEPLFRERPTKDEPYLPFVQNDGFACYVHVRALRQMAQSGLQAGVFEVIGRLGGRLCLDQTGTYVLVEQATHNHQGRQTAASVTVDCAAQEYGRHDFERRCRPLDCVGWWHTHPAGTGLFYSPTDRENQATWLEPHAIGIVLDPELSREGLKVFRGPDSVELRPILQPNTYRIFQKVRSGRQAGFRKPPDTLGPGKLEDSCRNAGICPHMVRPRTASTVSAVAISLASAAFLLTLWTQLLYWAMWKKADMGPHVAQTSQNGTVPTILPVEPISPGFGGAEQDEVLETPKSDAPGQTYPDWAWFPWMNKITEESMDSLGDVESEIEALLEPSSNVTPGHDRPW